MKISIATLELDKRNELSIDFILIRTENRYASLFGITTDFKRSLIIYLFFREFTIFQ